MKRKPKLDRHIQNDLLRLTDFDPDLISALATIGVGVHIPQGWSIMTEMTPGDSAYILLEGTVEIRKHGETRRTLEPGDVFGEIAVVDHRLRSASAVASTDVVALRLDAATLHMLVERNPQFAENLRSSTASRLEAF